LRFTLEMGGYVETEKGPVFRIGTRETKLESRVRLIDEIAIIVIFKPLRGILSSRRGLVDTASLQAPGVIGQAIWRQGLSGGVVVVVDVALNRN